MFDFGMARELTPKDASGDGTYRLSHMTGSLRYMAPEVALGQPYNAACDVYSFSLVVWEIMALKRPYHMYKDEATFKSKVFGSGHRPTLSSHWPDSIQHLIVSGWSAHPGDRLGMSDMSEHLRSELVRMRHGDERGLVHPHRRRSTFVFVPKPPS